MFDETKQDTLRTNRVNSTDRRVLKTRKKLVDTYRRMLDAGPADLITVQSLCREAGVTRSSFYAHFSGLGDLAAIALTEFNEKLIELARTRVKEGGSRTEVNARVTADIARYLRDHADTYRALLEPRDDYSSTVSSALGEQILTTLRTRTTLRVDADITARYMAAGTVAVLTWWLADDHGLSPEDLAGSLIQLASPDMRD